jgi:hypothetical protein
MALGDLSPDQARFAATVAKGTGLDPTVVAAWIGAESGWGVTKAGSNYLNIGPGRTYASTDQAAAATAELIGSSQNYTGIRSAVPAGPAAQVKAIEASPWDANHYGGGGLGQIWGQLYSAGGPNLSPDQSITLVGDKKNPLQQILEGAVPGAGVLGDIFGALNLKNPAEAAAGAVLGGAVPIGLQLLFIGAGLGLIVMGLSRLTGTGLQRNYEHGKTIVGIVSKAADLAAV